jgi:ABC-type Fe3+/spermidine/putrescine transport system ATPase subunit
VIAAGPTFDTLRLQGGDEVLAPAAGLSVGTNCALTIRPDRISVAAKATGPRNRVTATVIDVVYQGMVWQIEANLRGGRRL